MGSTYSLPTFSELRPLESENPERENSDRKCQQSGDPHKLQETQDSIFLLYVKKEMDSLR